MERTSTHVKKNYIEKLGPDLGAFFHVLVGEIADLQIKFDQFEKLFGKQEHVDLLNSVAAPFLGRLQGILWEDILLHIARLIDSAGTSGQEKLTINALPVRCESLDQATIILDLVNKANKSARFIGKMRNVFIAHRGLNQALSVSPLPQVSRKKVKTAIAALHAVINQISESLCGTTLGSLPVPSLPDVRILLYVLKNGVAAGTTRRKRLGNKNLLPDDLNPLTT